MKKIGQIATIMVSSAIYLGHSSSSAFPQNIPAPPTVTQQFVEQNFLIELPPLPFPVKINILELGKYVVKSMALSGRRTLVLRLEHQVLREVEIELPIDIKVKLNNEEIISARLTKIDMVEQKIFLKQNDYLSDIGWNRVSVMELQQKKIRPRQPAPSAPMVVIQYGQPLRSYDPRVSVPTSPFPTNSVPYGLPRAGARASLPRAGSLPFAAPLPNPEVTVIPFGQPLPNPEATVIPFGQPLVPHN